MSDQPHIQSAIKNGFSEKEAVALVDFVRIMTSRVVKEYIIYILEETSKKENLDCDEQSFDDTQDRKLTKAQMKDRTRLYKKVLGKVSRLEVSDFTGYQEMKFMDIDNKNEYRLRLQLAVVDAEHEMVLHIPPVANHEKMVRQIFTFIDRFIPMTIQYYQLATMQSKIINDLANFYSEMDMSLPKINKNNRTMYFDPTSSKRIGIVAYFVDNDGKRISNEVFADNLAGEISNTASPSNDNGTADTTTN